MRAVIQRVERAGVSVEGKETGSISNGLVVLLAVETSDSQDDLDFIKKKILNLRIFNDPAGKMNLSVCEVGGQVLLISQFTLYADCRKGNRPSYSRAAPAPIAQKLYQQMIEEISAEGIRVEAGIFQARMKVSLVNDGPVTVIVDSRKDFY